MRGIQGQVYTSSLSSLQTGDARMPRILFCVLTGRTFSILRSRELVLRIYISSRHGSNGTPVAVDDGHLSSTFKIEQR